MDELDELVSDLRAFRDERNWLKFHSPKNLSMALAAEVGELLAELRWLTEAETVDLSATTSQAFDRVQDEVADVTIFLLLLADQLNIDLLAAARTKMEANKVRFPTQE